MFEKRVQRNCLWSSICSNGTLRHFNSAHPRLSEEIEERGIDLNPTWHVLDLTPEGRGDWNAELDYGVKALKRGM